LLSFVFVAVARSHLYLDKPVSAGAANNNGGTTAPCNGVAFGSGTVTQMIAGSQYVLQMRANVHGSNSFNLDYTTDSGVTWKTIKTGLTYTITANTASEYNGFSVAFNVPTTTCEKCTFRLSGMGPPAWYNCATITIVAASEGLGDQCEENCVNGNCKDGKCNCKAGYGGLTCDTQTSGGEFSSVSLAMELRVTKKDFDKDVFLDKVAELVGLDAKDIKLVGPKTSDKGDLYVHIELIFHPAKDSDVSGVEAATIVSTEAANGNQIGDYTASSVENTSKSHKKSSYDPSAAAAGIVVCLLVVAGIAAGVVYWKKNPEKAPGPIQHMFAK